MSNPLDIHPASTSERVAMYRNTYEFWGSPGASVDEHVDSRMNSPQHNRANWFVGCLDGRPVCGLGAYPMEFRLRDRVLPGIAIGSVHTVPSCRRRGYAARLLNWAEGREIAQGAELSLLYSNIPPVYYERLGYRLCPCWHGWRDPKSVTAESTASSLSYTSVRHDEARSRVERLYAAFHNPLALSIHRNAGYWDYVFEKGAADEFGLLHDAAGEPKGCVQLSRVADDPAGEGLPAGASAAVVDWAAVDHSDETTRGLFFAVFSEAQRRGWKSVGGWLPDVPALRSLFELSERTSELTMFKPLRPGVELDAKAIASTEHFREIDHV